MSSNVLLNCVSEIENCCTKSNFMAWILRVKKESMIFFLLMINMNVLEKCKICLTILCMLRLKTDKEYVCFIYKFWDNKILSFLFNTYTTNIHSYILHFAYFTWTKLFNDLFWLHLVTF